MKRRYFGTDGVRGEFGGPVMNPGFAWRLGVAAGRFLQERGLAGRRVVIGRDTRFSGGILERALAAGLREAGFEAASVGVVPTPAVSFAVRHFEAGLGIVVTASHNPVRDNGIKFFSASGMKLADADELAIEALLPGEAEVPGKTPGVDVPSLPVIEPFLDKLAGILAPGALAGWKIVVDTANGAACETTPAMLRRLGADVAVIGNEPDGHNINAGCGSQHPGALRAAVVEQGARLGIAHDGDADRVLFVDEAGEIVDGDELLAILAEDALAQNRLNHRTLVATVQSNLALTHFMESRDGRLVATPVGDRYVAEAMVEGGFNLGGENSGHIICTDVSPCGDGLAAALLVLRAMVTTGRPLSELRRVIQLYPQATRALRVGAKPPMETLPSLTAAIRRAEERLGRDGRVLVRYSGTEPKIRLLVEGRDIRLVRRLLDDLETAVEAEAGLKGEA